LKQVTLKQVTNRRRKFLVLLITLAACSKGARPDQSHLSVISSDAGFRFPQSAKLVFEETAHDSMDLWIVESDEEYSLPGEKLNVLPAPIRNEIEKHIQSSMIGDLTDPMAARNAWENPHGRWRAGVIRGAGGYFLYLERFANP
jgi:hypothetical protein